MFTSPDGTVEFYVYSPQWYGEPSYLDVRANEIKVSDTSTTTDTSFTNQYGTVPGNKIARWITYRAKDGSYTRAVAYVGSNVFYVDGKLEGGAIDYVFGIKYTNDAAYKKYLSDYLAFKQSLVQYAD